VIILRSLDEIPGESRGAVVSIGNFDGVHLGHVRLIQTLCRLAQRLGVWATVFSFDPHPAYLLNPEQAPTPLTDPERKARVFDLFGVDALIVYPTDWELLKMSAREFFDEILCRRLNARGIVEGGDFRFGHGRSGDMRLLMKWGAERSMIVETIEAVSVGGQLVSSSRIRRLIAEGDVRRANQMLWEPYRICGTVIRGAGRGADLGYPTANLGQVSTLIPGQGIYAGRAWVGEQVFPAAVSIGPNPTFGEDQIKIEVYLIGFEGDLYGRRIEVEFLDRLRGVVRFASVAELLQQMEQDVAATRRIVEEFVHDGARNDLYRSCR